ncbi:hypothetical protein HKD37_08G023152 [Glycine soja]
MLSARSVSSARLSARLALSPNPLTRTKREGGTKRKPLHLLISEHFFCFLLCFYCFSASFLLHFKHNPKFLMITLSEPCRAKRNKPVLISCVLSYILQMASRKRKAPSTPTQARFDRSRFTSQEAWERYTGVVVPCKLLPERNVVVYYTEFDEFKEELERCHWDEELTDFVDDNINVAIVRVRGHLIKFNEDTLNTFLKTPVVMEEEETLCAYSRFALLRPDPQELTWSVLFISNLVPTSHTSNVTLDRAKLIYGIIMKMHMNVGYHISHQISLIAQHDTSRLGFPALITASCKARGVQSDSRSLESLSPAIITFRGPKKARGKRFEAPSTSASEAPTPSSSTVPPSSSTQIPVIPPAPTQIPLPAPLSAEPTDFIFTPQMLHSMLQSIHKGQSIIMQSLQGLGLPSIMSMKEFETQPSSSGGGGASTAQEPNIEEPPAPAPAAEEETTPDQTPQPSPAPAHIPEDVAPVVESEQPIQDSLAASALDLNENQPQEEQDTLEENEHVIGSMSENESIIHRSWAQSKFVPNLGELLSSWAKRASTAKHSFSALSVKENLAGHQHQGRALSARSVSSARLSARLALSPNPLTRAKCEELGYNAQGTEFHRHHSTYFGKRALEPARGATFAEIPRKPTKNVTLNQLESQQFVEVIAAMAIVFEEELKAFMVVGIIVTVWLQAIMVWEESR